MTWQWKTIIEPFKIKSIEPLGFTNQEEREKILLSANYNLFNIPADKVLIDLLTDSGTSAMSAEQWAGMMRGDESYAGARSFYSFEKVVKNITGYKEVIPTHQGRAAERILFAILGGNIISMLDFFCGVYHILAVFGLSYWIITTLVSVYILQKAFVSFMG